MRHCRQFGDKGRNHCETPAQQISLLQRPHQPHLALLYCFPFQAPPCNESALSLSLSDVRMVNSGISISFMGNLPDRGKNPMANNVMSVYFSMSVLFSHKLYPLSSRREWLSTPVFFPGESYGQRSLAGYSPWGSQSVRTEVSLFTFIPIWCLTSLQMVLFFLDDCISGSFLREQTCR